MSKNIYRLNIAGCVVELEEQWAVRIEFNQDTPTRPGMMTHDGKFKERAIHLSKEVAIRAICERMGQILDKQRGLPQGTGELLVMGAIGEELGEQ